MSVTVSMYSTAGSSVSHGTGSSTCKQRCGCAATDKQVLPGEGRHSSVVRPGCKISRRNTAVCLRQQEYCTNHPDEISKVAAVQKKVDEVKNIMVENIEKVLERGERIELLVDKTDDLRFQAEKFQKSGRQLRNKMWWANLKMKIIVVLVVLLAAVVIFLLACFAGGNNCVKKNQ
eukprot:jgi/Chrzof1/3443/Cz12g25180.t1